jgi:hypothetical protein
MVMDIGLPLRCSSSEEYGSCGKKQEPPVQVSSVNPTELACFQELLKRLQDRHVDCVNSSELRVAGFDLREVLPLQLEVAVRGARRTRGAALKQIHDMGTRRYVLSVDNDNEFRSRCE